MGTRLVPNEEVLEKFFKHIDRKVDKGEMSPYDRFEVWSVQTFSLWLHSKGYQIHKPITEETS